MNIKEAVIEYLRRETEANRKMRGADHKRIMDEVSREYDVDVDVLSNAVNRATLSGAN